MSYSEINSLRKKGMLEQAIEMAESEYAAVPGKLEAIGLFWCLCDRVKEIDDEEIAAPILNRMRELFLLHDRDNDILQRAVEAAERLFTPEGRTEREGWNILRAMQSNNPEDVEAQKRLLFQYLRLGPCRSSSLHSRIMAEALKIEKDEPDQFAFMKFADMWGLDKFRHEDWEQRQNKNGHILPSLAEKTISAYMRELNSSEGTMPSQAFKDLLSQAMERYPRNLHLPRYQAQVMAIEGNRDGAIKAYKELLMRTPDKFYLWDDLSDLVDDPRLETALLCGAVTSGAYDEYLPNIRLRLAEMMCNMQMYGNAMSELDRYRRTHEAKQWPLPRRYYSVLNRIPRGAVAEDNRHFYAQHKREAEAFIYSHIDSVIMVKTWEKKDFFNDKPVLSWQLRHDQDSYWIKPKRFHLNFSSRNGSVFNCKLVNGMVVWAEETELKEDLPWLKRSVGPLDIHEQGKGKIFAFVNDVFVPSHLFAGMQNGAEVTVVAILNGERWQALRLY